MSTGILKAKDFTQIVERSVLSNVIMVCDNLYIIYILSNLIIEVKSVCNHLIFANHKKAY
jgi:hypothetical protein